MHLRAGPLPRSHGRASPLRTFTAFCFCNEGWYPASESAKIEGMVSCGISVGLLCFSSRTI